MSDDQLATVWAATWIPTACPLEGLGVDGYAACWVDVPGAGRVQALVDGPVPEPGQTGRIRQRRYGAVEMIVFEGDV